MSDKEFQNVIQIDPHTWSIEDEIVRCFLLEGSKEAILIDCGMMIPSVRSIAERITERPVRLALTHADRDHIGCCHEFSEIIMHPSESMVFHNISGAKSEATQTMTYVKEGDVIDPGDRPLEVIHLPGHTPGSIAFLDRNRKMLFSGDPVQDGDIFMFGVHRDMPSYIDSLTRLKERVAEFDRIYPSHGTMPVGTEMIEVLIDEANKVCRDEISWTERTMFDQIPVRAYDVGVATFLMEGSGTLAL
ncbi:MAG: MBL fold metallo-hydrolase [Lachnospiraceae bacterium]|nr:MBL fold metallo-hydrolase [Lachnospiraceae bacterium]